MLQSIHSTLAYAVLAVVTIAVINAFLGPTGLTGSTAGRSMVVLMRCQAVSVAVGVGQAVTRRRKTQRSGCETSGA